MAEVVRCTKKYVMGFEYFAEDITEINYRGNAGVLWKADFAGIYTTNFGLEVVKRKKFDYINEAEKGNTDEIFLLKKPNS